MTHFVITSFLPTSEIQCPCAGLAPPTLAAAAAAAVVTHPRKQEAVTLARFNNGAGMCIMNGVLVHNAEMLVKLLSVPADRSDTLLSAKKSS